MQDGHCIGGEVPLCLPVSACMWTCVCEHFIVLGQRHGDKRSTPDLGLRHGLFYYLFPKGLGPSHLVSGKFSTTSQEKRRRSTEALRWAWDALQTPGEVGDQELMSTLGLAPLAGAPPPR